MNELDKFIKEYAKQTFSDRLKEEKIDEKKIKHFENFHTVKANSINEKDRTIEVVASKEVVDRQGDKVIINGISIDKFVKNPVVPFAHNYSSLPVAKAVGIKFEGDELVMKLQFASKELHEFADTVFNMFKEGFLNAVSIGFIPLKSSFDETEGAFVIEKSELLEVSVVPVPANQDALVRSFEAMKSVNIKAEEKSQEIMKETVKAKPDMAISVRDVDAVKEELEKAETIIAEADEEIESLKSTIEHNKDALKAYRKYQILLRDALKIEATEDEGETIKEVMDAALAVCRILKENIDKSLENPTDNNIQAKPKENPTAQPKKSLVNSALKAVEKL